MSNDSSDVPPDRTSVTLAAAPNDDNKRPGRLPQALSLEPPKSPESQHRFAWGPWSSVLYTILLYIVVQLVAGIGLALALKLLGWDSDRIDSWLSGATSGQFLYILITELLVVGGVVWFLRRRQISLRRIGWGKPKLRYAFAALAGFGVYFLSYIVVVAAAHWLIPQLKLDQEQNIGFTNVTSMGDLILTGISLVVLPPLAEEILFRGFLFGGLRQGLSLWPAAIITSLLFGAGHLEFGDGGPLVWVAALDTFVLSLVLCYVREKTDSLWPGIFIHAAKNALAFSVLFLLV